MTQFADLSPYNYIRVSAAEKNIGWLSDVSVFDTMNGESLLDSLWSHCKISVAQTRGIHDCELCKSHTAHIAQRGDERLLLGSAEIRVMSREGAVYAAPNLIYHYVQVHFYRPPSEFVEALLTGVIPGSKPYCDRLSQLGWSWAPTEVPNSGSGRRVRGVSTPNGVKTVKY